MEAEATQQHQADFKLYPRAVEGPAVSRDGTHRRFRECRPAT
jgi:hypothetical protein